MRKYEPLFLTLNLGFMAIYTSRGNILTSHSLKRLIPTPKKKPNRWDTRGPREKKRETTELFIDDKAQSRFKASRSVK